MCNLRSDCRKLVESIDELADRRLEITVPMERLQMLRAHMERACYQIDEVEERWHKAEQRAHGLELALLTLMRQFPRDDHDRRKAGQAIARWGNPSAVMRLKTEDSDDPAEPPAD